MATAGKDDPALGAARSKFLSRLPKKAAEVREALEAAQREPGERSTAELRRRLNALYASAQVFRLDAMTHALRVVLHNLEAQEDSGIEAGVLQATATLATFLERGAGADDALDPRSYGQMLAEVLRKPGAAPALTAAPAGPRRPPSARPRPLSSDPRSLATATSALQDRLVLLADADSAGLRRLTTALRTQGARVIECDDGQQALDAARSERPELIIAALSMPQLDGFALERRLRREPPLDEIPLVLVADDRAAVMRMRELGVHARAFVVRSMDPARQLAIFTKVLRPRQAMREALQTPAAEVHGRVEELGIHWLLVGAAAAQRDCVLTVRDAWNLFEVWIRGGQLASVTRTATDGLFSRGEAVLTALLGCRSGEFRLRSGADVQPGGKSSVRPPLPLGPTLDRAAQKLAATLEAVSGRAMVRAEQVHFHEDVLDSVLQEAPVQLREVGSKLRNGQGPRALLLQGGADPALLEALLVELARRGAVQRVYGPLGEDRVAAASHRRDSAEAQDPTAEVEAALRSVEESWPPTAGPEQAAAAQGEAAVQTDASPDSAPGPDSAAAPNQVPGGSAQPDATSEQPETVAPPSEQPSTVLPPASEQAPGDDHTVDTLPPSATAAAIRSSMSSLTAQETAARSSSGALQAPTERAPDGSLQPPSPQEQRSGRAADDTPISQPMQVAQLAVRASQGAPTGPNASLPPSDPQAAEGPDTALATLDAPFEGSTPHANVSAPPAEEAAGSSAHPRLREAAAAVPEDDDVEAFEERLRRPGRRRGSDRPSGRFRELGPQQHAALRWVVAVPIFFVLGFVGWRVYEQFWGPKTNNQKAEVAASTPPHTGAMPALPAPRRDKEAIAQALRSGVRQRGVEAAGRPLAASEGLLVVPAAQGDTGAGPQVVIGGRPQGRAPLNLPLPEGRYELLFRSKEGKSYRYIYIRAGHTLTVRVPRRLQSLAMQREAEEGQ
ncbi:MAG: response regulator [Polyangiales bacterium]